tara:strand:+ start:249 stop:431 length:183 start_codon:yes stop_codon:yes gene_type:complete
VPIAHTWGQLSVMAEGMVFKRESAVDVDVEVFIVGPFPLLIAHTWGQLSVMAGGMVRSLG